MGRKAKYISESGESAAKIVPARDVCFTLTGEVANKWKATKSQYEGTDAELAGLFLER